MSQRDMKTGLDPTFLVDATSGNETVYLPSGFAVSRKFTVRRADNSANTVTVALANSSDSLDGVVGGSVTVPGNGEKSFIPTNPGVWESFGWTGGGAIADGSVTPAKLSFDPATQTELDAEVSTRAAADTALAASTASVSNSVTVLASTVSGLTAALAALPGTFVDSSTYRHIVQITLAAYNELSPPDSSTIYMVVG